MLRIALCVAGVWGWCLLASAPAAAFDPPVATAGSLTVRIEASEGPIAAGQTIKVRAKLESSADTPIEATIRAQVIDAWTVAPSEPLPCSLAAKGRAEVEFSITASRNSYNALYPIHVLASPRGGSRELEADAVLVVSVTNDSPPRPQPRTYPWKPFPVTSDLALCRLPVRRTLVTVFGRETVAIPGGLVGSDPATSAHSEFNARATRGGSSREALAMHPPYRDGHVGTIAVQYPLHLPKDQPVHLRFAEAIRDHDAAHGEPPSDGVTYRVRVMPFSAETNVNGGEVVHEQHTDAKTWQPVDLDLSRFAGRDVIIQLESDPGPKKDTTCDLCYWAEPTLTTGQPTGATENQPEFPPPGEGELLGRVGATAPSWQVRLWPGPRGLLDAVFGFEDGQRRLYFKGLDVRIGNDDLGSAASVAQFVKLATHSAAGQRQDTCTFRGPGGNEFDVVLTATANGSALRIHVDLQRAPAPQPWQVTYLEDVAVGAWSQPVRQVYAGTGNVIRDPGAFELGFDGHRLSTSFVGFDFANGISLVQAVNTAPRRLEVTPDARRYTLHSAHPQTLSFIPATNVWEAARAWHDANGQAAGGGVANLSGRFVFDLWGGRYADSTRQLERAFRYGLTNACVVWHNWQRYGYDNRLPDIWPPNQRFGTLAEFRALAQRCAAHGVLFAPHDNYIDYYPDADGFSYAHIAFTAHRDPVKAWFNPGPKAQSYRWRPDHVRPVLEANVKAIRDAISPTAYFIDVWSSIDPYDYWTQDGAFHDGLSTAQTWRDAFAWIRTTLGNNAPQISESGHDALIGYLDGAQANHLRVGKPSNDPAYEWAVWNVPCADAERVPWFDAAHHDRFVLHGAGYQPRYLAGLDAATHGMYSDDYLSTEVLTGHPGMVDRPFSRDVVRKYWLLDGLMRRLALARIESVDFDGANLHRQHVRWRSRAGTADVWVNRGAEPWSVAGHILPEFGWYARVEGADGRFEAAVETLNGQTAEWAGTPASLNAYVGSRKGPSSFGPISTDAACRLVLNPADGALVITPLPDEPARSIHLNLEPAELKQHGWKQLTLLNEAGETVRTLPLASDQSPLSIATEPGIFAYRLAR